MDHITIILLAIVVIILAFRKRNGSPVPAGRVWVVFAAVFMMHVVVIGGLIAYSHLKHS